MNIKITVYDTKQFKKHGALKKNAKWEKVFGIVEEVKEGEKTIDNFYVSVAKELKKEYTSFTSPYIFTHIQARRKSDGEAVCIFENVGQFMTTPQTLFELLTK